MTDNVLSSVIEFDEDLNNVEAPKPLPMGLYDAVVQSVEPMMSKSERLMAKVTFSVSADQYPADYTDGNPNGTTLTQYIFLDNSQRSKFALKRFCQAIGAPLSNSVDITTWVGLPARIEVINEPWEGNLQARIKRVVA
ncbi:MAG: hypothetical protein IKT40_00990 [Bacilli bacterium]|jgi:hypothetical protein|nr:hypothetical protein [Bacilli bacterium]